MALDHIDRAMESIGVNLIRANSQSSGSPARANYLDVSIGSTYECAAALDVCLVRCELDNCMHNSTIQKLWRIRGMLLGLKRAASSRVMEENNTYGTALFPFSRLDMYRTSLDGVQWLNDFLKQSTLRTRTRRKLDTSTTGTVLNIAEGHGRETVDDQNRFMRTAQEHAYQTLLIFDLIAARNICTESQIDEGKVIQRKVIAMLHAWCKRNKKRNG